MANNDKITDMNTDWHGYSGASVQEFIKSKINEALNRISGKVGDVVYTEGRLDFYDERGGAVLSSITLTGTSYSVRVESSETSTNLTVLSSETSRIISLKPSTWATAFGSVEPQEFYEDYLVKVEVNHNDGNGWVDRTPAQNYIEQGGTGNFDIRKLLVTGMNQIRFQINGTTSGQMRTDTYTVTLTTMSLTCNHTWQDVWIGGNDYLIKNIYFAGNVAKTINIKIGDNVASYEYSAGDEHPTTPISLDISKYEPSESGIVPIDIWMESKDGVQTPHTTFNIIYVAQGDIGNVSFICVNNQKERVYNFEQDRLLQYAVYNLESITERATASYKGNSVTVLNQTKQVSGGIVYDMTLSLQVDLSAESGALFDLDINISSGETTYSATAIIDNSKALFPVAGNLFYLNTSINDNASDSKQLIFNSSSKAGTSYPTEYQGVWNNFTFADDAWKEDADGNRALVAKAGSLLTVPLKALKHSVDGSMTLEFMFRASNISDYDTPIITCMSTPTVDSTTTGLIVYPTRVVLFSQNKKDELFQKLPLAEDRIHHIAVVIERGYAGGTNNLAHIYINGCDNVTFSFTGTDVFFDNSATDYGNLVIGQSSTDTYLYMARIYHSALSYGQVKSNYLNAVIETATTNRKAIAEANDILDGGAISYSMCKQRKLNCFIIETDEEIPSLLGNKSALSDVNIRLEYGETPEKNVSIYHVPLDKQGTTSSLYPKWNLRMNNKNDNTEWIYADGTKDTDKAGYIDGKGVHPPCSKVTWKKNYASQPQGHKMGATGLYNDLYHKVIGSANLPNADTRVAVYQHPFMGFQMFSNGTYRFIGLYTGGPDKTDKNTFGYNEVERFPSLMMIEGPNHAPFLTRFLVPWTDDVFYDWGAETLSTGVINGEKQEGWDADIVGKYSSDKEEHATSIFNLYKTEFKPAYDAIYRYSPYIAHISETGYETVDDINRDLTNFLNGKTRGYANSLLTLYTDDYKLVYYRVLTKRYEVLPLEEYNLREDLVLTQPDTDGIVAARAARWKQEVGKYVDMREAFFRQCYDELIGASDNDAKNSYWRKFKALADGGKWGFNEDDLDTIFQNDNNGQDTKEYYIEPDDVTEDGKDIFQGRTSAFWYALRLHCKDELRAMMKEIVSAMQEIANEMGIKASTIHETVYNVIKAYFWDKSSKYFPAVAYNADTQWAYLDAWHQDPNQTYNSISPLTQVHGDHYETEKAWVDKRIAYMFSKYQIGAYEAGDADGYGRLEFTPGAAFQMTVKPAIWQYPRKSEGGAETGESTRTSDTETYVFTFDASQDTGNYIKGFDWLQDIGDISQMAITSRGGSSAVTFNVSGKRLRRLKCGDANTTPKFNASTLLISGNCIEEIDARNVATLTEALNLKSTPRLREVYLGGTNITDVLFPEGGRVEHIQYPDTVTSVVLPNINLLRADGLVLSDTAIKNIKTLYIENCDNIDPMALLARIYNTEGNSLVYIGVVWRGTVVSTEAKNLVMVGDIAKKAGIEGGYGGVVYENNSTNITSIPNISGTWDCTLHPVYISDVEAIMSKFVNLKIEYSTEDDKVYVDFEDTYLNELAKEGKEVVGSGNDGNGITWAAAKKITSLSGSYLHHNDKLERFNELYDFEGITTMATPSYPDYESPFYQCIALSEIKLPKNLKKLGNNIFNGCSSLKKITMPKTLTNIGNTVFANVPDGLIIYYEGTLDEYLSIYVASGYYITSNSMYLYIGGKELEHVIIPTSITVVPTQFYKCLSLRKVTFHDGITEIKTSAFNGCRNITSVENFPSLTSIPNSLFYGCSSLTSIDIPDSVTVIGTYAFSDCSSITEIHIPESVTEIQNGAFSGCSSLTNVVLPNALTNLGDYVFNGTPISELSFGENITSIGSLYTSQIKVLRISATAPPTLGSSAVLPSKIEKIYVPDVSLNAYKTATYWKNKATLIFPLSQYVEPTT